LTEELQELFRTVADLSPELRAEYFERHGTAEELRSEVESLLRFDTPGSILEFAPVPGGRCGPWEVGRLLGRGGMGEVYLAQRMDGEVEQRAAIKFVRDAFDPARLLTERRILASLSHPGIARLLDAGHTAAGQPWFVMEYIEGVPIDVYGTGLETRGILELFVKVCDAVAYAHRNLIIHRDLKPTNILVEADGQPRLLDFGIARILDDAAGNEATRERFLTPGYASPEQVRGAAQSTATDVYSLGAVLKRLLRERILPRDLDSIVAKSTREEPEQRYAGVDAFAADIRAFLGSKPVAARSGNGWYVTRKFLRRHWLPAAAAVAAILSLGIGLFVANRERRIAQDRFQQLRRLANRVLELDSDVYALPGSTKVRKDIVAASMEYLEGLGREARDDRDLSVDLANGYLSMARIQGLPAYANLGQFAEAGRSLGKAKEFAGGVLRVSPDRTDALLAAAETEEGMMMLADSEQHREEALKHAADCAAFLDRLTQPGRASALERENASRMYVNLGLAFMNAHRFDDALRYAKGGVSVGRSTPSAKYVPAGLSLMANTMRQQGNLTGALQAITEARALTAKTVYESDTARMSAEYAILWRQGLILGEDGGISLDRPGDAIEPLQKDFDAMEQLASRDANDSASRDRLGTAGRTLAGILRHTDPERALAVYDKCLLRLREIRHGLKARRDEATILAGSAGVLRQLRRAPEAAARLEDAFQLLRESKDYPSAVISPGGQVDQVMRAFAEHQGETGHLEAARDTYVTLLNGVMASKPDPENDLRQANDVSGIYFALAEVCHRTNRLDEAQEWSRRRAQLWSGWARKIPGNSFVERQMAK